MFQERAAPFGLPPHGPCFDDFWLFRKCCFVDYGHARLTLSTMPPDDTRKLLLQQAQHRPIVIDAASDPYDAQQILTILTAHGIDDICTVLTADCEFAKQHATFRYFPTFVLKAINDEILYPPQRPQQHWHTRLHRLSCLNRRPRPHRFLIYYLLAQRAWFPQVFFSFGGWERHGDNQQFDYQNYLTAEEWQFVESHQHLWPMTHDTEYHWGYHNSHSAMSTGYKDCYANLTTETSCSLPLITEKTTKCLRSGVLMFVCAAPGHTDQLSTLGFDMQFDMMRYDHESVLDERARIHELITVIDSCYDIIVDIWQANLVRLQHNSELFRSHEFAHQLLTSVKGIANVD
jgi:hypothetical protein